MTGTDLYCYFDKFVEVNMISLIKKAHWLVSFPDLK